MNPMYFFILFFIDIFDLRYGKLSLKWTPSKLGLSIFAIWSTLLYPLPALPTRCSALRTPFPVSIIPNIDQMMFLVRY